MNIPSGFERTEPVLETFPSAAAEKTAAQPAPLPQLSVDDQTHLSAVANIVSQSLAQPDVRTEKVAAIQSAIASGSYQIPSSQVAGKIIDHLLGEGS